VEARSVASRLAELEATGQFEAERTTIMLTPIEFCLNAAHPYRDKIRSLQ
jgi:hypothetical protein